MRSLFSIFFFFCGLTLVLAQGFLPNPKEHSYYKLGKDYSVPVYARPKPGAKLVLFNYKLADALGIDYPKDPKELEEWALKNYALRITQQDDPEGKEYFASIYQDSNEKDRGSARGDGRLIWLGEHVSKLPNGKMRYLDITAKGVGKTPLAWTNHSQESHKDGFLAMEEAIQSYVVSQALLENQMDTTGDLMVFHLPQKRRAKDIKREQDAAISIRVGNHMRIAHWRYFSDKAEKLKPLVDYSIRRDLGYPLDQELSSADYSNYLYQLAAHLGEESARSLDLLAGHGSPTLGNRTTNGASIDNNTTRFLDAEHVEHPYLFGKLVFGDMKDEFKQYIDYAFEYLKKIPELAPTISKIKRDELYRTFEQSHNATFEKALLLRHGLSPDQVAKVDPLRLLSLSSAYIRLSRSIDDHEVVYDEYSRIHPADIEMRKAIPIVMDLLSKGQTPHRKNIYAEMQSPSWKRYLPEEGNFLTHLLGLSGSKKDQAREKLIENYIRRLHDVLTPLDLNRADLKLAAERSKVANQGLRDFKFWEQKKRNTFFVWEAWKKTNNFEETSRHAQTLAERYIDPLVLESDSQHLGAKIPSGPRLLCESLFGSPQP